MKLGGVSLAFVVIELAISIVLMTALGRWLRLSPKLTSLLTNWQTYGGGRPKPPLYGIWDVAQLSVDGQLRPPLFTDRDRWRRTIFDFPTRITFQRLDDSFAGFGVSINPDQKTLALTKDSDKKWKASLTFERATKDQLILDGEMDGHKIHMQLRLAPTDKFVIANRGFHWISEYPFNR